MCKFGAPQITSFVNSRRLICTARTPDTMTKSWVWNGLPTQSTSIIDNGLCVQLQSPFHRCFMTTSRDMTARLFTLDPLEEFRPKTFAGHRDAVVGAYFSSDCRSVRVPRYSASFGYQSYHVDIHSQQGRRRLHLA